MKRLAASLLLCLLCLYPLESRVKAPVGLGDDLIKLRRKKKSDKPDVKSAKKKKIVLKKHKKDNGPLKDRPARHSSALKLPPTIINIEDRNLMRLNRSRGRYDLIPEIDRKDMQSEYSPMVTRFNSNFFNRKGGSRGNQKRTTSTVEATYGLYDSLSALLSTGQEFRYASYQVSYIRFRNEGFNKDGSRVANSLRGTDDLQVDLGWEKKQFSSAANIRFFGKMDGLQSNTNYTQSRRSGLSLFMKGSYIFSSVSKMKFAFKGGKSRLVLDNPTAQVTVDNYSANLGLDIDFAWTGRTYLRLGISFVYDDYNSDQLQNSMQREFGLHAEGGFTLGNFVSVKLACDVHFVDLGKAKLTPDATLTFLPGSSFSFFANAGREIRYLGFREMLLDAPYGTYTPAEAPIDGIRFGGGFRYRISDGVLLRGALYRWKYDTYYASVASGASLYAWSALSDVGFWSASLEFSYTLYPSLKIKVGYFHYITDDVIAYLPDIRVRPEVQLTIPGAGSILSLQGDFVGSRNDGALDPYFLFNIALKQPLAKNFYAVFRVDNLLNTDYVVREGYREAGITVHAGIHIKF